MGQSEAKGGGAPEGDGYQSDAEDSVDLDEERERLEGSIQSEKFLITHVCAEGQNSLKLVRVKGEKKEVKRYQGWPKVPAWRCEEWEASGDGFLEASFSPTSPQQHLDVDIWNVVNDTSSRITGRSGTDR